MSRKAFIILLIASNAVVAMLVFAAGDRLARVGPLGWLKQTLTGAHERVPVGEEGEEPLYWTCSMHSWVRADGPGQCPVCNMTLVPVRQSEAQPPDEHTDHPRQEPSRAGMEFTVDPFRQQLINVRTTPVEERAIEKTIRTVGILELDETGIADVYPRVQGWIQEVFAEYEHQHVHEGQPLFSIYSPELVATQEEYLLALRTADELGQSAFEHVSTGARSLLHAARRRLELFGVSPEQIETLERGGKVETTLVVHAPVSGHVIERNAFPNRYVTPDSKIYTIADHSRIWVWVQVYENEMGRVRVGQTAAMRTEAYPGETFRGRVTFISPHLDPTTRTLRVRLEFPNPDFRLKPEMYAEVELAVPLGRFLAVPDSAVLRTGRRDQVFVDRGEGRMELRPITVGEKAGSYYRVLSGLEPGERVVTHANFLIDSESKIRGLEADWETPRPSHAH